MKEYVENACDSDKVLATCVNCEEIHSSFVKPVRLEYMYDIFGFAKKHVDLEKPSREAKLFIFDAFIFLSTTMKVHLDKQNEPSSNWASILEAWYSVGRGESPLHDPVQPDSFADATIKRKAKAKDNNRAKKKTSTRAMTDHPWFVASTEAELPF